MEITLKNLQFDPCPRHNKLQLIKWILSNLTEGMHVF